MQGDTVAKLVGLTWAAGYGVRLLRAHSVRAREKHERWLAERAERAAQEEELWNREPTVQDKRRRLLALQQVMFDVNEREPGFWYPTDPLVEFIAGEYPHLGGIKHVRSDLDWLHSIQSVKFQKNKVEVQISKKGINCALRSRLPSDVAPARQPRRPDIRIQNSPGVVIGDHSSSNYVGGDYFAGGNVGGQGSSSQPVTVGSVQQQLLTELEAVLPEHISKLPQGGEREAANTYLNEASTALQDGDWTTAKTWTRRLVNLLTEIAPAAVLEGIKVLLGRLD